MALRSIPEILRDFSELPSVRREASRLESAGILSWTSVPEPAVAFVAATLRQLFPERAIVLVAEGVKRQEILHQDLETWMAPADVSADQAAGAGRALFYPAWEVLPHESKLPHADIISERLDTLVRLSADRTAASESAPTIVTSVQALMQRTFPQGLIHERTRTLRRGDSLEMLDLVEWLEEQGYEPEAKVTQKGEMSLRGGILDVYPLTSPWPVRLEFFGNELDSLRHFDPGTQMSREQIESLILAPAGEFAILKKLVEEKEGQASLGSLLEYLPPQSIFILAEPEQLTAHAEQYAAQIPLNDPFFQSWKQVEKLLFARGFHVVELASAGLVETALESDALAIGKAGRLEFETLDSHRPLGERLPEPHIAEAQRRQFFHQLHRWLRQGYHVCVFCNTDGERQRFQEIWNEYGLEEDSGGGAGREISGKKAEVLNLHLGTLTRGFRSEAARLVVVTDAEIFGRYKVQRPRRMKSPHAVAARSALDIDFTDLEEGDFVVHLQHGIGRYQGLKMLPPGLGKKNAAAAPAGSEMGQECLVIEYAPSDPAQPAPRLYVPVTEAHLVSKYVGAGKIRPTLNTLGGTRWSKTKEQAEQAVQDLASELLALQAARDSQVGHAFGQDTPWQREFEGSFIFQETPDQMRAIVESKQDMERPKPMDRLICGDVGYGKTEVAIRAAFKAVMDGRQVAVLVPTTILAQQHFSTLRERMADYPIRVEQLSRFRTRKEQRQVIQKLADGSIDIVVGTHRLIQEDVLFKDLGLVVIDEEQRFGVMHKEKFKLMRKLVDVLTLSATPIPRTLYLALTGARDMSTIETPPQDRLPVETIVAQFDERIIRDAIRRELNRQGQLFYLHNRVNDIENVALRIRALVPDARVLVGHGQMDADDLEQIMAKFINGEADVLVSTTIIESGIDIPNANTIIIDRADRFGLSDLYQLRGRVGRYKHQAYAYLLLPRHAALLSDVRKRISAIRQYSSLGSGFKIAMRDLEIRGAGNILGPQQSGHITAVGFDLYCQLLKQSISTLKGEKPKARVDVQVRLDFLAVNPGEEASRAPLPERRRNSEESKISVPRETATFANSSESAVSESALPVSKTAAYIPFNYIREAQQRIEIYRKLAQATEKAAVEAIVEELRDRFGKIPPGVDLLVRVAELRILASERGVSVIETKGDKLMLTRHNDYLMLAGRFPRLTRKEAKSRLGEIKRLLLAL